MPLRPGKVAGNTNRPGGSDDGGFGALLIALAGAVGIAIYTALTWAGITLATIIAGYIADRSGTPTQFTA